MCGVVGVFESGSVAQVIFDALTALQHRGQDAAGVATCDGHTLNTHKGNGLLVNVIRSKNMAKLKGHFGIGHVRYPTAGSDNMQLAQPFYVNAPYGICLAHNGNLTNTKQLRHELIHQDHRHLNTDSDSEILLNILACSLQSIATSSKLTPKEFFIALEKVYERCKGGFAVTGLIAGFGLFAFRDPHGIRPLIYGVKEVNGKKSYMISSESVALDCADYEIIADVKPGEGIFIDLNGNVHKHQCADKTSLHPCIFEYVYLSRPDSIIDGASVYQSRIHMGYKLGQKILREYSDHDIDVVIPVPDSGRHAALPIAKELNVSYREAFVKNRYIGRTFIMSGQATRSKSVRQKLNTIDSEFKDKHVLLVDDSIVRGTTSKKIIQIAREAGARKVSIASTAPPISHPNVYGIDMPAANELIAHGRSVEEIERLIHADHIFYQDIEDLKLSVLECSPQLTDFDMSVFDGRYITGDIDKMYLKELEAARNDTARTENA